MTLREGEPRVGDSRVRRARRRSQVGVTDKLGVAPTAAEENGVRLMRFAGGATSRGGNPVVSTHPKHPTFQTHERTRILRRFRLLITGAVVSVFAAFGIVAPAEAAVDYFLEVSGVPGESQDAKQAKTIDVESSPGAHRQRRQEGRPVSLRDLSVTNR